jgi:hypothetical protein
MAPAQAQPPKPAQQEREVSDAAQSAREAQLKRARAALGQEGSVLTSPFGSQQHNEQQRRSLLGG